MVTFRDEPPVGGRELVTAHVKTGYFCEIEENLQGRYWIGSFASWVPGETQLGHIRSFRTMGRAKNQVRLMADEALRKVGSGKK